MSCNCQEVAEKGKQEVEKSLKIPFVAHESEVTRLEKIIKRQWIAMIIMICMIFGCFAGLIWYESQFDTMTYEQDGNGINNLNYGQQGDVHNEPEGENQTQTKR